MNIGITGQIGFIGTHLANTLALSPDKFSLVEFKDEYFDSYEKMEEFVSQCDVIVHLAAMNRHNDPKVIYETNIKLVNSLVSALENTKSTPHVLFSSSVQEENNNKYGDSKKEGRLILEHWAKVNNAQFTGLIIPNVFGPFGDPYYNSVVATFCYQLTHGEQPKIDIDGEIKLIYVGELITYIINSIDVIHASNEVKTVSVPYSKSIKVSSLLDTLEYFKECYLLNGIIPNLDDEFTRNLFNTFVCYIDHAGHFPFYLKKQADKRGSFVEIIKFKSGGQISFSTTAPGITRGNHYHTRKAERFAVIKGRAKIEIRRVGTDVKHSLLLNGDRPSFVDMPIWYTHNIINVGDDELYTIFWINEEYDPADPDTYYEVV